MSRKLKLKLDFNDADCLEVEYKEGKWARVTYIVFRSYLGNRRVGGKVYEGPVYYEGTNAVYKPKGKEEPRVVCITELNDRNRETIQEHRFYDRDERYKTPISPNPSYL